MALVVGFEGLPGCGKTTAIKLLMGALRAMSMRVVAVDIDTSPHASALRAVADALPLDSLVRSMLFWAMRIRQYEIIYEVGDVMDVILADRTWGTALVYDGHGNTVSRTILERIGQDLRRPDITFYLEAPLEVVRARKKSRTMENLPFAVRVAKGYRKMARARGWIRVDATRTPEEIKECCLEIILAALASSARQP